MGAFDLEIIVLAAGLSRRMGKINKLMLQIEGEPLIRRSIRHYLACSDKIVVVVGYQAEQIRKALDGMDVRFVFNPEYEAGRQASVRVGLANIYADGEAVMIGLADQPLLNDHDLDEFINSYASGDREKIFIPYFNDIRGNPILIPPPIARQIQYDMKNSNCRKFIDGNPELTIRYKAPNSHFTTDIDTHEDALLFANRPGPGKSPILERE